MTESEFDKLYNQLYDFTLVYDSNTYNLLKQYIGQQTFNDSKKPFYFFMFVINWNKLYDIDKEITLYHVLSLGNKKLKQNAFEAINKLFNGEYKKQEDIFYARELIVSQISLGLKNLTSFSEYKKKGLNEFFRLIFDKISGVEYELDDFDQPYLLNDYQASRFKLDLFEKFIPAFETAIYFNTHYLGQIKTVEISHFFVLHVLLRHTIPFKFTSNYLPNKKFHNLTILNGCKKSVKITAHINDDNSISIISCDGEFFAPQFSNKQEDYIKYISEGKQVSEVSTALGLYCLLLKILPIFISSINCNFSPNIIYFDGVLYGIEFLSWKYKNGGVIEIGSIYPLNSEAQLQFGISKKDYLSITNKEAIPNDFQLEINNEE